MTFIQDLVVIIVYTLILSGNAIAWPCWQNEVDGEMDGLDAGPPLGALVGLLLDIWSPGSGGGVGI